MKRRVVDEILVSGKAGLADGLSLAAMKRLQKLGLVKVTVPKPTESKKREKKQEGFLPSPGKNLVRK